VTKNLLLLLNSLTLNEKLPPPPPENSKVFPSTQTEPNVRPQQPKTTTTEKGHHIKNKTKLPTEKKHEKKNFSDFAITGKIIDDGNLTRSIPTATKKVGQPSKHTTRDIKGAVVRDPRKEKSGQKNK